MPTISDRTETPYTEAVIHEVHRCANIGPLGVTHCAVADSYLGGKYFTPKDTNVILNSGHVMEDPEEFPDPHTFDPSRLLTREGKFEPHPMVIPFGVGKRRCLGETLARTSLYLFITGLLSYFTLTKENEADHLTTAPMVGAVRTPHPYKMRFIPRK